MNRFVHTTFVLCMAATPALAQQSKPSAGASDYPNKSIRLVVPSAPGGGTDIIARLIAQGLTDSWGQTVVVDNRGGAGGIAGMTSVAKQSAPDGYTMVLGSVGHLTFAPAIERNLAYDPQKDLAPITLAAVQPFVVAVSNSLPARSIKELVALAKARPGALNYSSGSTGSSPHLSMELFKYMTGTNIVQIPYKGAGSSTMALVGGQVEMSFASSTSVAVYIKAGRLKALAVTSLQPSALAPGVPTVAASVPGYESVSVSGMFAPAKTPAAVISRLNREMVRVLAQPDVKERFLNLGAESVGSPPEQLGSTVASEMTKWGKVIQQAGIRMD